MPPSHVCRPFRCRRSSRHAQIRRPAAKSMTPFVLGFFSGYTSKTAIPGPWFLITGAVRSMLRIFPYVFMDPFPVDDFFVDGERELRVRKSLSRSAFIIQQVSFCGPVSERESIDVTSHAPNIPPANSRSEAKGSPRCLTRGETEFTSLFSIWIKIHSTGT